MNYLNFKGLKLNTKVKVFSLIKWANRQKLDIYIFEWLRTQERQYELFGYWRDVATVESYWVYPKWAKPNETIRTWTLQSNHLTWNAVDIVFDQNSDPKINKPSRNWNYKPLVDNCKYFGLRSLVPIETCHFENDWRTIAQVLNDNMKIYKQSTYKQQKTKILEINEILKDSKNTIVK